MTGHIQGTIVFLSLIGSRFSATVKSRLLRNSKLGNSGLIFQKNMLYYKRLNKLYSTEFCFVMI